MTCHCSPTQPTRVIFFVLIDMGGRLGQVWPERDPSRMDRASTLQDLRSGELYNVVQIIETEICGFEISSRDVTECLLAEAAELRVADREPIMSRLDRLLASLDHVRDERKHVGRA
jgi:hypothetical protein